MHCTKEYLFLNVLEGTIYGGFNLTSKELLTISMAWKTSHNHREAISTDEYVPDISALTWLFT